MKSGEIIRQSKVAEEIKKLHGEFLESMKQNLERAIRIGELLTNQKSLLKHGEFIPWIEKNVTFSDRTARSYMQLFHNQDRLKTESVSDLGCAYRLLSHEQNHESEELAALEGRLQELLDKQAKAAEALREIRDQRLYREEFDTFSDYCMQRFDMTEKDVREEIAWAKRYRKSVLKRQTVGGIA